MWGSVQVGEQCEHCDGLVGLDILWAYKLDTDTNMIVENHVMYDGAGGDQFGSPDDRLLAVCNVGEVIRLFAAGKNCTKLVMLQMNCN